MSKKTKMYNFTLLTDENRLLLKGFKASLVAKNMSDSTIYPYCRDIYNLMLYLQNRNIEVVNLDSEIFLEYVRTFENKGISSNRILKIITAISKFYDFLKYRKNIIQNNPIDKIDRSKWRNMMKTEKIIRR